MAAFTTSAQLLDFCKDMSGLPAVNNEMTDPKWYRFLSLSQEELFRILVAQVAASQFGPPVLLTTSDGGYSYDFAAVPWGRAEVKESRNGALLQPGAEYDDGADFVIEGVTKIRWTNNQTRQFGDGPYARYAVTPGAIDADNEPTLMPEEARIYIAWRALEMWASRGRLRDPSFYARELQKGLHGDPLQPGHTGLITALKTRFINQGGIDGPSGSYRWWANADLTSHGLG